MSRENLILKIAWMLVVVLLFGPISVYSKEPVTLKIWSLNWPEPIEQWNILSKDLEKIGIQVEIKTGPLSEWVGEIIGTKNPYHVVTMTWSGSPERMEASWFLSEFFHSNRAKPGGRNYGYYVNPEYDKTMDAQLVEVNADKRKQLIWKAQELIDKDNAFFPIYFKDMVQAYNSDRLEGVIPTIGSGIGFPYLPWTFYKAKPKTNVREPRIVNMHDPISVNPFAGSAEPQTMGWLKLVYDPLAIRDVDTDIIPWAAESWKNVDNKTVDIVLRKGMKFHDGKPVTVEDVKFTFDYILKWKFPPLSQVWRNIESVQTMDDRRIRIKMPTPYSAFTANVLTNVFIVPKHIWEKIPESVGVANPMDWPNTAMPIIGSGAFQIVEWKKQEYLHQ